MPPINTPDNAAHSCPRYAIFLGQFMDKNQSRSVARSGGYHCFSGHLRRVLALSFWLIRQSLKTLRMLPQPMGVTSNQFFGMQARTISITRSHSPLAGRVQRILGRRTQKQVCRITARWVITFVAYQKFLRIISAGQVVGYPMTFQLNLFTIAPNTRYAIPLHRRQRPLPAITFGALRRCSIDTIPKKLDFLFGKLREWYIGTRHILNLSFKLCLGPQRVLSAFSWPVLLSETKGVMSTV